MNSVLFVVKNAEEGGYHTKAETESIFTQGDTLEELVFNIEEAIRCHFNGPVYPAFKIQLT